MKRLIIIGAGGFGREMYAAAREAVGFGTEFIVAGFLDDNSDALTSFVGYPDILGNVATYQINQDDVFITAIGSVNVRRKLANIIATRGGTFISIIHQTAIVGPNVKVGRGSFLAPNVTLTADVNIGEHSCIFHNSSIGHDTIIGDFSHVYAQCAVGGAVRIGDEVSIYPGAVVVPRRKIANGAVVGAGAVVFTDVPAATTVFGNPATPIA